MYSLLISDGRPPPRWVSYFSRRHVVITEMFMSGIWPCMYVFVGIHFVMVATWLWKASQLFQFRVGFTSSLKFKKCPEVFMNYVCFILGGRQGLIMNPSETTAESNEEICVARARGRLQYKMEVVEGWQKKTYPHCRKLCFLLCASPLQSSISSHGPEQTWRRLWLTRRSLGLTWGCPLLMYVCMYLAAVCSKSTQVSPTLIHVL